MESISPQLKILILLAGPPLVPPWRWEAGEGVWWDGVRWEGGEGVRWEAGEGVRVVLGEEGGGWRL